LPRHDPEPHLKPMVGFAYMGSPGFEPGISSVLGVSAPKA
jgi:hypothetical protein